MEGLMVVDWAAVARVAVEKEEVGQAAAEREVLVRAAVGLVEAGVVARLGVEKEEEGSAE
jgi:hypothetical protein